MNRIPKGYTKMKTNIGKIFPDLDRIASKDTRSRFFIPPAKIIRTHGDVKNAEVLIGRADTQAHLTPGKSLCTMKNTPGSKKAGLLIDYGREIHGCVRVNILTSRKDSSGANLPFKARLRFGESISEAITPIGVKNATNDHAIRDSIHEFSFMSSNDTSETGFRYLYFELTDDEITVSLNSLAAVLIINDYPYIGSFDCDDKQLNEIWKTAAYTVQLNIQQYFWDGIKRDRLVWLGDMNTEICTAYAVFGDIPQIRESLDFGVETTPLPGWMNTIPSYSFWWIINLVEFYMHTGDKKFVMKHSEYISGLTKQILNIIEDDGNISSDIRPFIDWSTKSDNDIAWVGFKGILAFTLKTLPVLLKISGDDELIECCARKYDILKANAPSPVSQKIATSLLMLGELVDAKEADEKYISVGGAEGYSTFMGYSILNAKAKAGNLDGAIDAIKEYWGAMLDMGATTFWEDFDLEWTRNATRIDEFPVEGKDDIHGDFGKHCYIKLRHSLCHGWASGPCPWLTENVLGIHILEPGMKKILIKPYLGNLSFADGTVPTPYGVLSVSHTKDDDGNTITVYEAPEEIEIIVE